MVMRILIKSINKSFNILIINKLHFLFTDLFTVYDYIYFWIQLKEMLLKNICPLMTTVHYEISIVQEVENKRTCGLLLYII